MAPLGPAPTVGAGLSVRMTIPIWVVWADKGLAWQKVHSDGRRVLRGLVHRSFVECQKKSADGGKVGEVVIYADIREWEGSYSCR
jgi:hypothetical protein